LIIKKILIARRIIDDMEHALNLQVIFIPWKKKQIRQGSDILLTKKKSGGWG